MTTERRACPRTKLAGETKVVDAAGTSHQGTLHDIGRGGLFVATDGRVPVGKLVDLEVTLGGEILATNARVVWVRTESAGVDAPAGLGLKFIDIDEAALALIDRAIGLKKNVRERTILGIAAPTHAPDVSPPRPANVRERTVLGLGAPVVPEPTVKEPEPAREAELSWPDEPPPMPAEPAAAIEPPKEVPPPPAPEPPAAEPKAPEPEALAPEAEPEPAAKEPEPSEAKDVPPKRDLSEVSIAEPPKRPSWQWVVLVFVALAAVVAYTQRDLLFGPVPPTPPPTPSGSSTSVPDSAPAAASVGPVALDASGASDGGTDAGLDSGSHDAGRDAGHDAGKDAGKPRAVAPPKPTTEEPY